MDGVLADFDRGVLDLCGFNNVKSRFMLSSSQDDLMWEKIRGIPHFYDRIEPLNEGVELFRKVYKIYGDKCEILTGIPKPKRGILTAAEDKAEWAKRILSPDIVVHTVFREQKKDYCKGPGSILIDDMESNIDAWTGYGGTGLLYKDAKTAEAELQNLGII